MAHEQQQSQPQPAITNPFAPEPPARVPQLAYNTPNLHVRRTGLIPLAIGASRMVTLPDGKRQFEARELRVEAARAERDGRTLRVACVCFECRKMHATYEDLAADHPSMQVMAENGESHTWAYWCSDPYDPKSAEVAETLRGEIKALEAAHKASRRAISEQKDIEAIMRERKRCDEIASMLDEARKKLKTEQDNIIGLMSETPFAAS